MSDEFYVIKAEYKAKNHPNSELKTGYFSSGNKMFAPYGDKTERFKSVDEASASFKRNYRYFSMQCIYNVVIVMMAEKEMQHITF